MSADASPTLRVGDIIVRHNEIIHPAIAPSVRPSSSDWRCRVEHRPSNRLYSDRSGAADRPATPTGSLEDPDSPESRAWIDAENKVTFAYLEQIPAQQRIRERLTKLWNYEKYGTPFKRGEHYFYSKRRVPEPVRPVHRGSLRRNRTCCSTPTSSPPTGKVALFQPGDERRRQAHGLRALRGRLGLAGVADPRRRSSQARRPDQVDQVHRGLVDQGQPGLLLQPFRRTPSPARNSRRPTTTRKSSTTRSSRRPTR